MSNIFSLFIGFLISFGLLIIAMSVHEFSHGWVAYKLGDSTAKFSGRLTLNPLAHVDIFWTFLLPLFLFITSGGSFVFGAAKPVPVNYWALRNPKRDMILIGLAGPLSNFILAGILAAVFNLITHNSILALLLINLIQINVILGVFNLIPIPPLDGSRILMGILPEPIASKFAAIEPYAFIILIVLIWRGGLNFIIWPLVNLILRLIGV